MSTRCPTCPGSKSGGQLLCRPCWFAIPQDLRDAVNETYADAKATKRRGQTLRDALLASRPYRQAAVAARKAARAARGRCIKPTP